MTLLLVELEPSPEYLLEKCRLADFKKPIIAYSVLAGEFAMDAVIEYRLNGYVRRLHHDFFSLAELLKLG